MSLLLVPQKVTNWSRSQRGNLRRREESDRCRVGRRGGAKNIHKKMEVKKKKCKKGNHG